MSVTATDAAAPTAAPHHPITLIVNDDLKRSRLTVFFRLLLVIPHFIFLYLWTIVAEVLLLVTWLVTIFTGRVPGGLHSFLASYVRYLTRVNAYLLLLANPWPPFSNSNPYPVDVSIDPPEQQGRITVFFRLLLAIPAMILTYVFRAVNTAVAVLGWFYALIFGRMNEGMRNISAWLFRYETQTIGYIFLLTGKYPSLAGGPTV